MKILVAAIAFGVTIGGLFLFESYKTPPQEQNYAKIVSELQQSSTPKPTPQLSKTPIKTGQPIKKLTTTIIITSSPIPTPAPTPKIHIYYTSSSTVARYYYCDTDPDWKNLSKANLQQFSSPEELFKSFPTRTLHEQCK